MSTVNSPIAFNPGHNEPVASVLRCLNLDKDDNGVLTGASLPQLFDHVYGGQVLAQAILAAAATVDETRLDYPHAVHAQFLRAGATDQEISFHASELLNGRSFASRHVSAFQGERQLLTMTASFQKVQQGLEHEVMMPSVPAPDSLPSALDFFRLFDNPVAKFLGRTSSFDLRHVDGHLYAAPLSDRTCEHRVWFRPRHQMCDIPQIGHRALITYVTDQLLMEPVMRRQGLFWRTPGLALASLDYSVWFHRDIDINDWHLFSGISPAASGARGLSQCAIFNSSGHLVANVCQQAMVRVPAEGEDAGRWAFDGRGLRPEDIKG